MVTSGLFRLVDGELETPSSGHSLGGRGTPLSTPKSLRLLGILGVGAIPWGCTRALNAGARGLILGYPYTGSPWLPAQTRCQRIEGVLVGGPPQPQDVGT